MSGDYYIVTTRKYRRFESVEQAEAAVREFRNRCPSESAQIIRCKTKLDRARHYNALVGMVKAFVARGATGDNIAQAQALLEAVHHRHPEVTP